MLATHTNKMATQIALTKEQLADINTNERQLLDQLANLDKLDECGVDCAAMKSAIQEMLDNFSKLKANFGSSKRRA